MAVHFSHACLPYPIRGARFSFIVPALDADGDPTAPTTPDFEIDKDAAGSPADCAEEFTAITSMAGMGWMTLSGAETDCVGYALNLKSASGPKFTLLADYPRNLVSIGTGTLSAGSAGGGTLGTALLYDLTGCFVKTTGGTGGGGTGGANNQARKIATYTPSTGAFTVFTNWETTPDATTTYEVLLPEGVTLGMLKALNPTVPGRTFDVTSTGAGGVDWGNVENPTTTVGLSGTTVKTATDVETDTQDIQSRLPAALTGDGNIKADTLRWGGTLVASANVLTAAAVAAIWDALTSGLSTANSIGKLLVDNVNATISSRSSHSAADVWSSGTRTLSSFGTLVTDIAAAVWAVATSGLTSAGTIGKLLVDNINATMSSRASQASVDDIPNNAEATANKDEILAAIAGIVRSSRPTFLTAGNSFYWTILVVDEDGLPIDADDDPVVDIYKDGSLLSGQHPTISHPAVGEYRATYNPTGEAEGEVFEFLETVEISAVQYSYTWPAAVIGASSGGGSSDWTSDERTAIRSILGVPGSGTTPETPTVGILATLAAVFAGITSLAQWLGLIAGKQTGNSTAREELRGTGAGSGTYNETDHSLEAIRNRGDAAWTTGAGGGGAGTGARTVTITIDDGTTELQNAIVRMTEGVNTYANTTDVDGECVFNLDDATYVVSVTKSGYSFSGTTLVVNGTENATYSMTQIVPSVTAAPLCSVTLPIVDQYGAALVGEAVEIRFVRWADGADPTPLVLSPPPPQETDGSGLVTVDLYRMAEYTAIYGASPYTRRVDFTVPDAGSYTVES